MRIPVAMFLALVACVSFHQNLVEANFYDNVKFNWGSHLSYIWNNGNNLQLKLDNTSGSGIETVDDYLFGSMEMQIKLVPHNSAGTVTAYYLSSKGDRHDEIDFEFLGNSSGQPYTIHTNVFTQGEGNREQQFYPWFDPTADFHNYTIHWNPNQIVWFIDEIPIRVFSNNEKNGIAYPNEQAMKAYASIWNAEDWATRGGLVKIDWSWSPFLASLQQFNPRGCKWYAPNSVAICASKAAGNWWSSPEYSRLSDAQKGQLKWVRDNYMIYDYCKDGKRFDWKIPRECYMEDYY